MSKQDKTQPADSIGLPGDDAKSRRELLAATAKLSALISAVGLTGIGLSEAAEAADTRKMERLRRAPMHKVRPKGSRRLLPAVQKRQMKLLLNDALRSGDSRLALRRHSDLKLSPRQRQALMRVSKADWAHLRRLKSQLAPLNDLAAGDTGYVFW